MFQFFLNRKLPRVVGADTVNHPYLLADVHATTPVDSSTGLFIRGAVALPVAPPVPLYIHGWGSFSNSVPLFTKNWNAFTESPTGFNLFLKAHDTTGTPVFTAYPGHPSAGNPNSPTLFVSGSTNTNWIKSFPLYINGFFLNTHESLNLFVNNVDQWQTIPLFISGNIRSTFSTNANRPLYVHGAAPLNNSRPLFIKGPLPSTGTIPLFLKAATASNRSVKLFISGSTVSTEFRAFPLYLHAEFLAADSMNMFVQVASPGAANSRTPLSILGSVAPNHALIHIAPLFISGEWESHAVNLSIHGIDRGPSSEIVNLFVGGKHADISNSSPLFVCNLHSPSSASALLFVQGDGQVIDAFPSHDSVNLFIKRGPQDGCTLFIYNRVDNSSAPFFVRGAPSIAASAPLFLDGQGGTWTGNVVLFVGGKVATPGTQSFTIAIPHTLDRPSSSSILYTHGFQP